MQRGTGMRYLSAVLVGTALMVGTVTAPASAMPTDDRSAQISPAVIAPYTVSPGKFGPLTMGVSTRSYAMRVGYLKRTRETNSEALAYCNPDGWRYYTHVGDYADFRQRADGVRTAGDVVSLWVSSPRAVTSKGLRTTDSITKLKRLYPTAVRTVARTEWGRVYSVYTVRSGPGFLDIIRHWCPDREWPPTTSSSCDHPRRGVLSISSMC